ncbi:5'-methylthioadenosine/adenosylhomocysteine nucleosidase [Flavobacterium sp. N3904]|uniref:5'-methylthioadenosine/adenosylhomocysteine nucleosidase n=1 Tax=Flavobacterium sp. N3904 TaxID=2986835 RepID=UPI0022255307|nr:5'-methylthioadenosine/adenosylhomocysteine nucleosidase [Flavobacterium sp. N3904]
MKIKRIGILGAMPEEINGIVLLLENKQEIVKGMRTYYIGTINEIEVVVVFSRWGKVASATTVTHLIVEFNITQLYFIGVAGAISQELNIGDIVIANSLVQHDMDARPIMRQFEIPLLSKTFLYPPSKIYKDAYSSIKELETSGQFLDVISIQNQEKFLISNPRVFVGQVASGDKFFSNTSDKNLLLNLLPDVLCVEMEGAAVAQVCFEYDIPFVVIRTISDAANETSPVDFKEFIVEVALKYGIEIIRKLIK